MKSMIITPMVYKIEFKDPTCPGMEIRVDGDSATITIDEPDEPVLIIPDLTEFAALLSDLAEGRETR